MFNLILSETVHSVYILFQLNRAQCYTCAFLCTFVLRCIKQLENTLIRHAIIIFRLSILRCLYFTCLCAESNHIIIFVDPRSHAASNKNTSSGLGWRPFIRVHPSLSANGRHFPADEHKIWRNLIRQSLHSKQIFESRMMGGFVIV